MLSLLVTVSPNIAKAGLEIAAYASLDKTHCFTKASIKNMTRLRLDLKSFLQHRPFFNSLVQPGLELTVRPR
jgi:hypothetical protein